MIIEMHCHTMISSPCSMADPEAMLRRAAELELDGLCVTEHDAIYGNQVVKELSARYGIKVFSGVEVSTRNGHLLVYGVDRDFRPMRPAEETCGEAVALGGFCVPAHPFRKEHGWFHDEAGKLVQGVDLRRLFTALEASNGRTGSEANEKARRHAHENGMLALVGSDAHEVESLGMRLMEFEDAIQDDAALTAALRAGRCRPARPLAAEAEEEAGE